MTITSKYIEYCEVVSKMNKIQEENKMANEKLYHGTCGAFIAYALQNGNQFGPNGRISFTPEINHARMFADSWNTQRGKDRLQGFFGELSNEYSNGIVLEFNKDELGELKEDMDAGAVELVGDGPIDLNKIDCREVK